MKVLELFSGSKVLSETFEERGHDTYTVDKEEEYDPDMAADILELNVGDLPEEFQDADVVWASPPCTTFSQASQYLYWDGDNPAKYETYLGLALAKKTFEMIEKIKPSKWFVENPRGRLRSQHFTQRYRRVTVHYCMYGEKCKKPTDIWTNTEWAPRGKCRHESHSEVVSPTMKSLRNGIQNRSGTYERAILPLELCDEVARFCEGEPVNNHKLTEQGLQRIESGLGGGDFGE